MFFFSKDCRKYSYIVITRSICTSLWRNYSSRYKTC
jgi:hypothetical protein